MRWELDLKPKICLLWARSRLLVPSDERRQKLLHLLGSTCLGSRIRHPVDGVSSLETEQFTHSDAHLLPVSNEIPLSVSDSEVKPNLAISDTQNVL